jgi:hypothetical protein
MVADCTAQRAQDNANQRTGSKTLALNSASGSGDTILNVHTETPPVLELPITLKNVNSVRTWINEHNTSANNVTVQSISSGAKGQLTIMLSEACTSPLEWQTWPLEEFFTKRDILFYTIPNDCESCT